MSVNHTLQSDRPMAKSLGMSVCFDRPTAISTVRYGWNFNPGSGVT